MIEARGMTPIETTWRGFRFRSRTEARWAVLFAVAGIRFEYEREGYCLPSGWYLPDFWLPDRKEWFEVKGQQPNPREITLARDLSKATKTCVMIGAGAPESGRMDQINYIYGDDPVTCVQLDNIPEDAWARARGERFDGKGSQSPSENHHRPHRWW